jgi:DNA mismatch endonuclease, patch repair protein
LHSDAAVDRSENMSRIRGRDTAPEIRLRKLLWQRGLRYRLAVRISSVRPDLVFTGPRLAVFVDGCFWHGCPEHYVRPRSSNAEFWARKLLDNVSRDERQTLRLEADGWRVLRVWEHALEHGVGEIVDTVWEAVHELTDPRCERWAVVSVRPITDELELRKLRELRSGRIRQVTRSRSRGRSARSSDDGEGSTEC